MYRNQPGSTYVEGLIYDPKMGEKIDMYLEDITIRHEAEIKFLTALGLQDLPTEPEIEIHLLDDFVRQDGYLNLADATDYWSRKYVAGAFLCKGAIANFCESLDLSFEQLGSANT
jgi:hypothetical protein